MSPSYGVADRHPHQKIGVSEIGTLKITLKSAFSLSAL